MKKGWVVQVLWLGVFLVSIQVRSQNQVLVIEGGTLIDGTGGAPLQNAVVVIEGSRIKSVGTKGQISYPPNARILKEDGKTILPGLIDCHIHLRDWMPQMFLHYGVTTVYDTNNMTDWIVAQREALKHGKIKGPRMFVSGASIGGIGLTNNADLGGYLIHVATAEEARAAVKNNVAQGVDMIKTDFGLTSEVLKSVVEEATKEGVPVVGHSDNIRVATLAGLKFMEHTLTLARAIIEAENPETLRKIDKEITETSGHESMMNTRLFDPLIKLMVKEGVYINPTFAILWGVTNPRDAEWAKATAELAKDPAMAFVPADVRQSWSQTTPAPQRAADPKRAQQLAEGFKKVQEFTRRYVEAGGRFVAGTDAGILPGLSLSFEMQSLVDAGLTPMQAILAATKWPAELLHKDKDLGTVAAGKVADITVVAGDPLKDITATRNVLLVIKDGEIIDTSYDPKFVNPMPRSVNNARTGPDRGPEISSVTPKIAREGDPDLTVQVVGKKFSLQSVVRFDTTDLKTQFVSDSQLTAVINSSSLKKVGTYAVTVVNPGSGGGTSNLIYFIVNFKY